MARINWQGANRATVQKKIVRLVQETGAGTRGRPRITPIEIELLLRKPPTNVLSALKQLQKRGFPVDRFVDHTYPPGSKGTIARVLGSKRLAVLGPVERQIIEITGHQRGAAGERMSRLRLFEELLARRRAEEKRVSFSDRRVFGIKAAMNYSLKSLSRKGFDVNAMIDPAKPVPRRLTSHPQGGLTFGEHISQFLLNTLWDRLALKRGNMTSLIERLEFLRSKGVKLVLEPKDWAQLGSKRPFEIRQSLRCLKRAGINTEGVIEVPTVFPKRRSLVSRQTARLPSRSMQALKQTPQTTTPNAPAAGPGQPTNELKTSKPLGKDEQKVFNALAAAQLEKRPMSQLVLSHKTGIPADKLRPVLKAFSRRGLPVSSLVLDAGAGGGTSKRKLRV